MVDGVPLSEAVAEYEAARGYDPAGGYGGLVIEYFSFDDLNDYSLGAEQHRYWGAIGKIAVLACDCGEVGCWPLHAAVAVNEARTVTWADFEQPHRGDRDYSVFGPFEFDLAQYLAAIEGVVTQIN